MRVSIGVLMSCMVLGGAASAQPTDSVAAAEQLFDQARALSDAGNFAAACPRFEASQKLSPALGTLLNIAACYDKLGQIASAWGHYREVIVLATKAGDTARADIARDRIKQLEPRLPRLLIRGPATAVGGLVVTRDDATFDLAGLGGAFYVDPGEHVVSATAPGRIAFTLKVSLAESETKEVQIADLAIDPHATHVAPASIITTIVHTDLDPGRDRRLFGLTLGGAGIAAVVTGVGFGVAARSSWNGAFGAGLCDRTTLKCSPAGQARADAARSRALVANIVGGTGLALVAGGALLYFTAPHRPEIAIAPTAGGATVSLGGAW